MELSNLQALNTAIHALFSTKYLPFELKLQNVFEKTTLSSKAFLGNNLERLNWMEMKEQKIRYEFLIPLSGADRKDPEGLKRIHEKDPFCLFCETSVHYMLPSNAQEAFCSKSVCKNLASTVWGVIYRFPHSLGCTKQNDF